MYFGATKSLILNVINPISIKRIYEEASAQDGYRMLVDRLWPIGVSKEESKLDEWNKEIAPTADLRKWFDHEEVKFPEFSKRYFAELDLKKEEIKRIFEIASKQHLMLLYSAKNEKVNQAVGLRDYLDKNFKH